MTPILSLRAKSQSSSHVEHEEMHREPHHEEDKKRASVSPPKIKMQTEWHRRTRESAARAPAPSDREM